MNKKIWITAGSLAGIAVLAAVVYLAISRIGGQQQSTPNGSEQTKAEVPGAAPEFVYPTQQPARQPDLWYYEVIEVKDHSTYVRPFAKTQDSQAVPQIEVVTVAATEIFRDNTQFGQVTADNKLLWTAQVYSLNEIKPGDTLSVWGEKRGDRLIAEVIMVYVCRVNEDDGSGYITPYHPICGRYQ